MRILMMQAGDYLSEIATAINFYKINKKTSLSAFYFLLFGKINF